MAAEDIQRKNVTRKNNVSFAGPHDAPVVMLAHGFGCDQNLWRLVARQLSTAYRVVLFDHVGSGAADPAAWDSQRYSTLDGYVDDIVDIVEGLDLRNVTFVGHSVAAMMGVLSVARTDRFTRLVLVAPSPRYIDDGEGYRGGFSRRDIEELLESLESNYLGWSRSMAPVIMGNPDRPELGDELTDSFCRTDPDCARVFARTTFLSDNRDDLHRVTVPTLVIDCAHDAIAPPEVGRYVVEHIPDCESVTIATDGHCPQLSAPDATTEAIVSFLSR
ncbi:alpha/beta hydrolase [Mycolicibacterium agri]|uniref:Hydrolase n=1 Tax=Mycolicibacterium agri TaxID=36811 RepID=A0A2A7N9X9_MYCAG|nr:alpha/beta hydrolase [Mycolicibacterium agri]PEG40629.1 alpha/beta hydrolase [Mycolicibacterium agri]GFG50370.1 hydrolase [Mycolicibacterium agri]